jgi:GntR family transcriptional repressor for pyruvate dehydrogenase complex
MIRIQNKWGQNLTSLDKVREYILRNKLRPGDKLPTHEVLCEQLEMGIRPLREGLSILREQGWIETRRRGGTIIKNPSTENLAKAFAWHLEIDGYTYQELLLARAAIESAAAAESARSRNAKDLLKMLDALEQMEETKEHTDSVTTTDQRFHLAVLEGTHNSVLLTFGQLIRVQFKYKMLENISPSPDRLMESTREHRKIYNSIDSKNPDQARALMYSHILK